MASDEAEIRALFERRSEAIRMKEIDRLMPLYSPDIVYFDVVPPLRYAGAETLRSRFVHWFDGWKSSIGQETTNLTILVSGDVAAAHMLIRASGVLRSGQAVGYWLRVSNFCQRSNDRWLMTHEHVSLPVAFPSGTAAMDLAP